MINGKHNFIVYIRSTIDDAKMSLANIRNRIEESKAIQKDFNIILMIRKPRLPREVVRGANHCGQQPMIARSRGQKPSLKV